MKSNSTHILTTDEALALADRYFEAQTTEAEERLLKLYVASEAAADCRFDEVRAVMGLAAYSRKAQPATGKHRRHRAAIVRWAAAIAVVFAASATIGTATYRNNNQCVAYIGGKKVTDTEKVMQAMQASIDNVGASSAPSDVEAQLGDMFDTME